MACDSRAVSILKQDVQELEKQLKSRRVIIDCLYADARVFHVDGERYKRLFDRAEHEQENYTKTEVRRKEMLRAIEILEKYEGQ